MDIRCSRGVGVVVLFLAGCGAPDWLGGPCKEEGGESLLYAHIQPQAGTNEIAVNPVAFNACESWTCLSSDGSVPYCTRRCTGDADCVNGNGLQMHCQVVTSFGPLACEEPRWEHCPDEAEDQVCCERDPATNDVVTPAMYCMASKGGQEQDPCAVVSYGADPGPFCHLTR